MAYDVLKLRYPGAPCAVGARVRHKQTGRTGNIAPQRAGDAGLRVKFDGEFPPKSCDPRQLAYLDDLPSLEQVAIEVRR